MKAIIFAVGAIAALGVTASATAQTVHRQEHRQEQRIRQGERSGRLTPAEAQHLQILEARVRRTEARMRSRNGGRLDWRQRRRLERMIHRDNAEIYRLKHNRRGY